MDTGTLIRNARKARNLTQKQLGELSGIAEPTIRRYELGKLNPKIETLQKIANALEISIYELKGLSDVEAWYAELSTGIDLTLIAGRIHKKFDIPMDMAEKIAEEVANLTPVNTQDRDESVFQQLLNRLTEEGRKKGKEYLEDLSGNPKYNRAVSPAPPKIPDV